MISGKSFEYALLLQFEEKLKNMGNIEVIKNSSYNIARNCFNNISSNERTVNLLSASFAVNFLIDIEPRLSNELNESDVLQLEIQPDQQGQLGDVRDVLAIRLLQNWEIGVSAKNNHSAVKHSRLSGNIDFGEKWIGIKSSTQYFNTVIPIFNNLQELKRKSGAKLKWSELDDYHTTVYIPILSAFIKEIKSLYKKDPSKVASNIVTYLVGNKDFYKVIKRRSSVEIHAFNLNGTLNLPFKEISPKYLTPRVPLPTKIIDIKFKEGSNTTVVLVMNNDWTLSFRIHNASSRVEPSLKFDINLLKSPRKLFKNTLNIND